MARYIVALTLCVEVEAENATYAENIAFRDKEKLRREVTAHVTAVQVIRRADL